MTTKFLSFYYSFLFISSFPPQISLITVALQEFHSQINDLDSPSDDLCDPNVDCTHSLIGYNDWSTNQTDYVFGNDIIDRSEAQQTFGGKVFGRWDLIKKTFSSLPAHTTVTVEVSVKFYNWGSEAFLFTVDSTSQSKNFVGTSSMSLTSSLSHTDGTLTVQLQSTLND